jgi:proline-specific peptidase
MPYVRHALGRTYFVSRGRGKGLPLVFLHGGPGGRHEYDLPLFRLAKGRKVFLYDQLGCGRSSTTKKNRWNVETFVRELDLLVKKWGLKEFHLGGGSWGATLALEYYLRKNGKGVRSLTFQSPLFSAADWRRDAEALIAKMPPKERKVIRLCHEVGATDSQVYRDATFEYYARHVLRNRKKLRKKRPKNKGGAIYQYMWGPSEFRAEGTLRTYERGGDLSKIRVPTLLVCGEFDEARPATIRRYRRKIKGAKVAVLKNCSHAIFHENPKALVREIGAFLGGQK